MSTRTIGLLGDESRHLSHQELNALVTQVGAEYPSVTFRWLPTDSAFDVGAYDGIWLVPGSPYADDAAVLGAIREVRLDSTPFLGTCGGMQYAVMEFLRTESGLKATHAESDGEDSDNVVIPLACSLYGVEAEVRPLSGSRFATWVSAPFVAWHFCHYAPSAHSIAALEASGVVVGATGPDVGAEVLEFPNHPFFVTSMFQPHVGALAGAPIHPLIRAFLSAVITGR